MSSGVARNFFKGGHTDQDWWMAATKYKVALKAIY